MLHHIVRLTLALDGGGRGKGDGRKNRPESEFDKLFREHRP